MHWILLEGMPHTKYYGPMLRITHYKTHDDLIFCLQTLTKESGWSILHSIKVTDYTRDYQAVERLKTYAHQIYTGG